MAIIAWHRKNCGEFMGESFDTLIDLLNSKDLSEKEAEQATRAFKKIEGVWESLKDFIEHPRSSRNSRYEYCENDEHEEDEDFK